MVIGYVYLLSEERAALLSAVRSDTTGRRARRGLYATVYAGLPGEGEGRPSIQLMWWSAVDSAQFKVTSPVWWETHAATTADWRDKGQQLRFSNSISGNSGENVTSSPNIELKGLTEINEPTGASKEIFHCSTLGYIIYGITRRK